MLGNVAEWCADVWHDNYAGEQPPVDGSAWVQTTQPERVLRGGHWGCGPVAGNGAGHSRQANGCIRAPGALDDLMGAVVSRRHHRGLVLIVGCSHPGILPMLEQIKRQTGRPIYLVLGGFHLLGRPEAEMRQLTTAMDAMGVRYVSAAHCSGEVAVHAFRNVFGQRYVSAGVGAVIDCPLTCLDESSAP
jgi:metal-dependent hydrolase (beta-lactamase superfamily II)